MTLCSKNKTQEGKLVKGPDGFALATFEDASLDYRTEVPNLLLEAPAPKVCKKPAMKKPAAAEASAAAEIEHEGGKDLASTLGMVYFSDEESDSTYEDVDGEGAEENGEEETPKEDDPVEEDPPAKEGPDAAPASAPHAEADATRSPEVGRVGQRYTKMYYKNGNKIGIRRTWLEEGYKMPRQAFCFAHKDVPATEEGKDALHEIGKQVVAKLAEGMSETGAEQFGNDEAYKLGQRFLTKESRKQSTTMACTPWSGGANARSLLHTCFSTFVFNIFQLLLLLLHTLFCGLLVRRPYAP